jgi:fatty-acyl-CoA synthase
MQVHRSLQPPVHVDDCPSTDLLGDAIAAPSARTGVTIHDERRHHMTWRDVVAAAHRATHRLAAGGVQADAHVLLALETSLSFPIAFLAVRFLGAVPVPVPAPSHGSASAVQRLRVIAGATCASHIIVDDDSASLELGSDVGVLMISDDVHQGGDAVSLSRAPHDVAFVQFTSGSTSSPKGVVITQSQLNAQLHQLRHHLHMQNHDVIAHWLPLFHDMGLVSMLLPLATGVALHLRRPSSFVMRPATWIQMMSSTRATISVAPSSAYAMTTKRVKDDELAGVDLSSWRIAIAGAEPVRADVMRAFGERFEPVGFSSDALMPAYGLAESTLAVTLSPLSRGLRTANVGGATAVSSGVPVLGCNVRIVDAAGNDVDGAVGEIVVRSPSGAAGYLHNPEATARAFVDGELRTGDLGCLIDGELYVVGRSKDVIIVRGQNISAEDVEQALLPVLDDRTTLAFGVPATACDGERIVVCVGLPKNDTVDANAIALAKAAVRAATGVADVEIVVVPQASVPRTTSGKVRRAEARRLYLAGELR